MKFLPISRPSFFSLASLAVIALGAAAACSSTTASTPTGTSGSSGTSGGTAASAADCASRCEAKFTKCGGDAASSKSNCASQVCNASPSAEQLTCLEGKACDAIAGAMSFAALCPGSASTSGGTSGGTSGTPTGAMCGTATCAAAEYCSLTYDSSAKAWTPSSCKKVPAACSMKDASELCSCMKTNSGCPTSGLVSTKCSQDNGSLSFGCE